MNHRFNTTLLVLALLAPLGAGAQVSLAITVAPPPLPYYAQPPSPGDGYIWSPGYWAWAAADSDYYWVPGTWVEAPGVGDLWTPGYWAYEGTGFFWHGGYWARAVGYYGGVNYGYGYSGTGYQGGHWSHNRFVRARVAERTQSGNPVSFNGGAEGTQARPPKVSAPVRSNDHRAPGDAQMQHERAAVMRPAQRATGSHEQTLVAATPRPMAFEGPGVEHARGAIAPQRTNHSATEARSTPDARPESPSRREH